MKPDDLFTVDRVFIDVDVSSSRDLLSLFARRAQEFGLVDEKECLDALVAREELGSTALGNGVALPHARIAGLEQSVGMLATLSKSIDFEAIDQEPVDVAIMLLMPERSSGEQIKVLAAVARIVRQEHVLNALRRSSSPEDALATLRAAEAEQYQ